MQVFTILEEERLFQAMCSAVNFKGKLHILHATSSFRESLQWLATEIAEVISNIVKDIYDVH